MKKVFILFFLFLIFVKGLFAKDVKEIMAELALVPASKASVQWERIFKSKRKLKKYGLDKLNAKDREDLKEYLILHSADSDLPQYAGDV